jgi:hypothetical protein
MRSVASSSSLFSVDNIAFLQRETNIATDKGPYRKLSMKRAESIPFRKLGFDLGPLRVEYRTKP